MRRRDLFHLGAQGLGASALLHLLLRDGTLLAQNAPPRMGTHFAPRVKRAVQICLVGGLSHLDSLDYKPGLASWHGKSFQGDEQPDVFFGQIGLLRQSDWSFRQYGHSGMWISDLFPHLATQADQLTVIRSMVADSANHTPALFMANSGFQFNGYPSLGSWLSFGLGSETDALPAYVVLADGRGGPNGGASNWSSGFLPAQHQGVVLNNDPMLVRDLYPSDDVNPQAEQDTLALLAAINQRHLQRTGADSMLEARIQSYALAAKMQLSAPEAADLSSEPDYVLQRYGVERQPTADMGRRCLLARRLLERGVSFVQLFSGGPIGGEPRSSWDAHESVRDNHALEAKRIDQPVAALLEDLKQRGMLDDTLVLFTTEFGRTPFAQSNADQLGEGRDHNKYGFSIWMAGGGLKPGIAFGATDEIGWKAVENLVPWHDLHATILKLFGVDHERLSYYHNGIQRRLTNVHGHVIQGVLA